MPYGWFSTLCRRSFLTTSRCASTVFGVIVSSR